MPSEQEIQHHRTFLSLHMCRTIYNDDERHQNNPGGVPNRKGKIDSDPVFKYHVRSCPGYPRRAPGQPIDRQYYALLARDNGSFEPLEIIPKRDQRFESVATPWELLNSVLCGGTEFNPVVNSSMEVTGHSANVSAYHLIHPKGIDFKDISDFIKNEIEIHLWISRVFDVSSNRFKDVIGPLPPEWVPCSDNHYNDYNGGVSVLVLPNGKVISARGHQFQSNNGHAIPTVSPLDFWTPGQRLVASAIRGLTNRVGGAVSAGFRLLRGPTKELAASSVARLAGKTLPGMAVSTRVPLSKVFLDRRAIMMGEDMLEYRLLLAESKPVSGFYDVMIHGDETSFLVRVGTNPKGEGIFERVSVREVADAVRPHLKPGDAIRLLSCETGACTGGPAQQFANVTNRTVWAPTTKLPAADVPTSKGGIQRSFIPVEGGKFYAFDPIHRGDALAGKGGKVTGDVLYGEIPHAK